MRTQSTPVREMLLQDWRKGKGGRWGWKRLQEYIGGWGRARKGCLLWEVPNRDAGARLTAAAIDWKTKDLISIEASWFCDTKKRQMAKFCSLSDPCKFGVSLMDFGQNDPTLAFVYKKTWVWIPKAQLNSTLLQTRITEIINHLV